MAVLFITHDLAIVRKMADRVCVMQNGEIVEQGACKAILDAPQHPYTRMLMAAEPKGKPLAPAEGAPVVVEAEGLKVWFPIKKGVIRRTVGHVKAVDGVSLSILEGQTVGVVGESGSGKTTLGLALLRLIAEADGPVVFLGQRIDTLASKVLRPKRKEMQIVFQDPYGSLSPRLSVGQIVGEGLSVHGLAGSYDERRARVGEALEGGRARRRHAGPLSRTSSPAASASASPSPRALVLKPRFIVLDEPTSALDVSVQAQIVELLRDVQARHKLAYLFISHDLKVVRGAGVGGDRYEGRQGGRGRSRRHAVRGTARGLYPRPDVGRLRPGTARGRGGGGGSLVSRPLRRGKRCSR